MNTKKYHQFNVEGGNFYPIGKLNLVDEIEPGYYSCGQEMSGAIYLQPLNVVLDGLVKFNDNTVNQLLDNVRRFWESKAKFDKINLSIKVLYKRGFLLYGPAGTGKTSLLSVIIKDVIDGNGVAILFDGPSLTAKCIKAIRDVNPDKRVAVIIEDIDGWIRRRSEEEILDLLDGIETNFENVIFLATTNHVDKLSKRVLRPSRFDFKIKIDYPPIETRRQYLTGLFDSMKFSNPDGIKNVIERMCNDSDKFSFADVKELFLTTAIFGYEYEKTLEDIKNSLHTEDDVRQARAKNKLTKTADSKPEPKEDEDTFCHDCGEPYVACVCKEGRINP